MAYEFKDPSIEDNIVISDDIYYDLFEGDYIYPSDILERYVHIDEIECALATIRDFINEAQDAGVLILK